MKRRKSLHRILEFGLVHELERRSHMQFYPPRIFQRQSEISEVCWLSIDKFRAINMGPIDFRLFTH